MNSKKVVWIILLILASFFLGYLIAPKFLDAYLESSYPKYDGNPVVGYQYLIEGQFTGYGNATYANSWNTEGTHSWIVTPKTQPIQVSLNPLNSSAGYKICNHLIGDKVTYIVIVDGNQYGARGFVLKREIC